DVRSIGDRAAPEAALQANAEGTRTDQMTRRPRTVSGSAGPGLIGVRLVPTVLLADADAGSCEMFRDALLEGVGPTDLRTVESADELEDYLHLRGGHTAVRTSPPPAR